MLKTPRWPSPHLGRVLPSAPDALFHHQSNAIHLIHPTLRHSHFNIRVSPPTKYPLLTALQIAPYYTQFVSQNPKPINYAPVNPVLQPFDPKEEEKNSPVRPLLIQHAMPTRTTPNRLAPLELDVAVAVAARVFYGPRGGVHGLCGGCGVLGCVGGHFSGVCAGVRVRACSGSW